MDLQILVNIGTQTIPIYINRRTPIYQIKHILLKKLKINSSQNVNIDNIYLSYGGKLLDSLKPISVYDIPQNSIIFAQFKFRGGILGSAIKTVVNKILSFLNPITKPLKDIILAVVSIVELIVELLLMLPKYWKLLLIFLIQLNSLTISYLEPHKVSMKS